VNNRNLALDELYAASPPTVQPKSRILDEQTLRYCASLLERRAAKFTLGRKSAADALRVIATEILLIADLARND
jgi:hypothetical protein